MFDFNITYDSYGGGGGKTPSLSSCLIRVFSVETARNVDGEVRLNMLKTRRSPAFAADVVIDKAARMGRFWGTTMWEIFHCSCSS